MPTLVAYYRVSTQKQGQSGLGLEAQQATVKDFASCQGSRLAVQFTEVESGKKADRPELLKALAACKTLRATLVVAKLDRLARNVAFLSALMDSGVDFVCCDNPHANRLTIHILAAVAEDEARRISERTKAALTAYKARGGVLGAKLSQCRNLTAKARQKGSQAGAKAVVASAVAYYAPLWPIMAQQRTEGATLQQIADNLNTIGHQTQRGNPFSPMQVKLVLDRYQ